MIVLSFRVNLNGHGFFVFSNLNLKSLAAGQEPIDIMPRPAAARRARTCSRTEDRVAAAARGGLGTVEAFRVFKFRVNCTVQGLLPGGSFETLQPAIDSPGMPG